MAEQVLIQFRADKRLKQEVSAIYEALGLDLPTAFRIFMKQSVSARGLPFHLTLSDEASAKAVAENRGLEIFNALRQQAADMPEMTMEEIVDDIAEWRKLKRGG